MCFDEIFALALKKGVKYCNLMQEEGYYRFVQPNCSKKIVHIAFRLRYWNITYWILCITIVVG